MFQRTEVDEIIQRIPAWNEADSLQMEPLQGLTNTNYLVIVEGERYVLRVSGSNGDYLGINREQECEVVYAMSEAGIGAPVEQYLLPEGHLVTRYIAGRHLTLDEYRTHETIERIVDAVKRLHAQPFVEATFSPFRRVDAYAENARTMGVPFPPDMDRLMRRAAEIETEQAGDTTSWRRFCHNDLFSGNVLDGGRICFIDWEFAGMGDLYFDLATLTYAYDSLDTLSRKLQAHMLACYFGEVRGEHWSRLDGMKYMLLFFSGMWGLVQQGLQERGLVRAVEGFRFLTYAEATFEAMRAFL